jgi:predicted transcriptional regulator of viral defense system
MQVPKTALQTLASGQGGLFSRQQAIEVGVSPQLLQHYLSKGVVQRVRRAIYRLVSAPVHPHEDLIEYWLWSDQEGVFCQTTALELWGLGNALGVRAHMALPTKWERRRITIPKGLVVQYEDIAPADIAWSDVVPMTAAAKTVVDCAAEALPRELVAQAIEEGVRRGLFRRPQVRAAGRYVRKGFTEASTGTE